ncbi:MAG: protein-glutamate O-methyltransferase CheR [Bacteroidetes bacterium]|nr:protein-glutamate O-methyltransferase CheR [Bacteroidota bacterium]
MQKAAIENIEINLLLQAIYERYGYDFRNYARASVERRTRHFASMEKFGSVSEMIPALLNDERFFEKLVREYSITVTELFRDPVVYRTICEQVFPILATWPFVRIWHAGCATGEEVYSMAILLKEYGLYDKTTIFATDFNDEALQTGRKGIYNIEGIQKATANYQIAGGNRSLSDYYHAKYDSIVMAGSLSKNITFANHNLVNDGVFGEMNFILCRNVMIYFDIKLQERVLDVFRDSLVNGGFLCLGTKESMICSDINRTFIPFNEKQKIYRRIYSKSNDFIVNC